MVSLSRTNICPITEFVFLLSVSAEPLVIPSASISKFILLLLESRLKSVIACWLWCPCCSAEWNLFVDSPAQQQATLHRCLCRDSTPDRHKSWAVLSLLRQTLCIVSRMRGMCVLVVCALEAAQEEGFPVQDSVFCSWEPDMPVAFLSGHDRQQCVRMD